MTSIVIPYAPSYHGNLELKYCLRSIEKHLKGVKNIFVIGADPKMDGVIHILAEDAPEYSRKERNVFNKLLLAASMPEISDPFLVVHDDHYLLEDYEAGSFPNYYSREWNGVGLYLNTVQNTRAEFPQAINFDLHCPLLMYKVMLQRLTYLDWTKKFGYCIKSAYAQAANIAGSDANHTTDLKLIDPTMPKEEIKKQLQHRKWFSVGDHVFRGEGMKEVMEELYPAGREFLNINTAENSTMG